MTETIQNLNFESLGGKRIRFKFCREDNDISVYIDDGDDDNDFIIQEPDIQNMIDWLNATQGKRKMKLAGWINRVDGTFKDVTQKPVLAGEWVAVYMEENTPND